MSRLEGGCVIYKGQSEAVIYARYLPGSVRSRVIYRVLRGALIAAPMGPRGGLNGADRLG